VFAGKFSTYGGSDPAVEGQRYHAMLVVFRSVKPASDRSGAASPGVRERVSVSGCPVCTGCERCHLAEESVILRQISKGRVKFGDRPGFSI
jgi:hypothetical protein